MKRQAHDASEVVVVGSGINSLVCAAMLAAAGRSVTVLERNETPGGCVRTEELFPGYRHDLMAAWYPLFVQGPAYAALKPALDREGLRFVNGEYATGLATTDGRGLALRRGVDDAILRIDGCEPGDGAAFGAMAQHLFGRDSALSFGLLGSDLHQWSTMRLFLREWRRRGANGLIGFAAESLEPFRHWLERSIRSGFVRALMAPWVLHTGLGPDDAASGLSGRVAFATTVANGIAVPVGGADAVPRALLSAIERSGGRILFGVEVERIVTRGDRASGVIASGRHFEATRAVVCSVTPQQLYGRLLPSAPESVRRRAMAFRFGRGDMQVHFALKAAPRWNPPELARVPLLHVADRVEDVCLAVAQASNGLLPAAPTLAVGQPVAVDPTRAPEGAWILWVQALEMPVRPMGDAAGEIDVAREAPWSERIREAVADRIQARLENVIPDLRGLVVGRRAFSPADLETMNCNLVGGDPYSGACAADQLLWLRPLAGAGAAHGHRSLLRNLFHIGASTHPGPGLGGVSGYLVARRMGG